MKNKFLFLNKFILIFLIFGINLLISSFDDFIISFSPTISFEDILNGVDVEIGNRVEGNVMYSFSPFASESSEYVSDSESAGSDNEFANYYVVPMGDYNFLGLKIYEDKVSEMDILVDETYIYYDGGEYPQSTVFVEGKVVQMDGELASYYYEYMIESNFTEEEIDAMGTPLYIEYKELNKSRISFILGIIIIIFVIAVYILNNRNTPRKNKGETFGNNDDSIEKDLGLEL